ncbi:hypothetical protein LCD36_04745 [Saccharopolyspora sp. 6T]|uniref:hypothetical protein n=1 Tax=Saccharopolyspora sp. 6T TaxID=2877238 RepID=UPI001CD2F9BB|nr:hypothetical protein [Saccharopolyspora sp. 6T]MCA1185760.1 hypothetical protein [Saccharopolyspora sp. 6T]
MDELPYPQWDETELVSLPCPDCGQWFEIPVFLDWDDRVKVAEQWAEPYVRAHAEGHPRSSHPDLWMTPHGDVVERRK